MNVKPLFTPDEPGKNFSTEEMLLFLDLPDEHPDKRAFLNHCVLHPEHRQAWQHLQTLIQAGKALPEAAPPPSLRAHILDMAYAERNVVAIPDRSAPLQKSSDAFWNLPGWKAAWAALFLVISTGMYLNLAPETKRPSVQQQMFDNEILSLELELESLNQDFEWDYLSGEDQA